MLKYCTKWLWIIPASQLTCTITSRNEFIKYYKLH